LNALLPDPSRQARFRASSASHAGGSWQFA